MSTAVSAKWFPDDLWAKIVLGVMTLQTLSVIGLESIVILKHVAYGHPTGPNVSPDSIPAVNALSTPIVIYPVLYVLSMVCLFVLCIDALHQRNQIQVVAFTIFNFMCFAYGIVQLLSDMMWAENMMFIVDIAIVSITGLSSLIFAFSAWQLSKVFGWETYKWIGADLRMRKMRKGYEILITLLKLDVFFFVSYAIQMFTLVGSSDDHIMFTLANGNTLSRQQIMVGLSIPASMVLLVLSYYGVRRQNRVVTLGVLSCLAAVEIYLIYMVVYLHASDVSGRFINSSKYLTFFIAVTFILVLLTLFFMFYCYRNFGKGLELASAGASNVQAGRKNTTGGKPFLAIDEVSPHPQQQLQQGYYPQQQQHMSMMVMPSKTAFEDADPSHQQGQPGMMGGFGYSQVPQSPAPQYQHQQHQQVYQMTGQTVPQTPQTPYQQPYTPQLVAQQQQHQQQQPSAFHRLEIE